MARGHPRLLSGDHLQPSLHARMETAENVHDADPFQNRPALGASREIDVEAPVRGGRRMLEDVGIHPLDAVVHMQHLGRGSKRQLVDFDLVNPRLGSWRGRTYTIARLWPLPSALTARSARRSSPVGAFCLNQASSFLPLGWRGTFKFVGDDQVCPS